MKKQEVIDEDEVAKEIKRERARKKQKEKREELKQLELAKGTLEYQKKINKNRQQYGLKKRKLQGKMFSYFTKKKSTSTNSVEDATLLTGSVLNKKQKTSGIALHAKDKGGKETDQKTRKDLEKGN